MGTFIKHKATSFSMAKVILTVWALLVASSLAGCASQPKQMGAGAPSSPEGNVATPTVHNWTGHIVATELEAYTHHFRPEEDVAWPLSQAGILFSVDEIPQAMEVALDWEGSGELMIMLHSHKDHGTNVYVEHVTALSYENPKCLRVPSADLSKGTWQVMVHSNNTWQVDFTFHIGLLGGVGHVIEDERHGHWRQDGKFEVDKHAIEPCQVLMDPRENATAPAVLPAKTHFAFGETLGCRGQMPAIPPCREFLAGPGGTGAGIDGHWIPLGQSYWNLMLNSTIDQVGIYNDSDCLFTDADGDVVGQAHNLDQPCVGQVPERADWLFIFSYGEPALSITVDFALPPASAPANTEAVAPSRGA